jgi:hypothetical protein
MHSHPLARVWCQCSKRSANAVKAASAGVSIGVNIGSISQIAHEMGLYLRSIIFQMSRTATGSTPNTSSRPGECRSFPSATNTLATSI